MRVKTVRRYACDHCGRSWSRRKACESHEPKCFKNPGRTPYVGELTFASRAGKVADEGPLVETGDRWLEWVPWGHEEGFDPPPWWPGPGKIWNGETWENVRGWFSDYPQGAHGFAGGPPPRDHWPRIDGRTLDKWPPQMRLEILAEAAGARGEELEGTL